MAKDLFSGHAKEYAAFRPSYPEDMYQFIFSFCTSFECAWDCGTGNGQVASRLSKSFTHVDATDISEQQIREANRKTNINYHISAVESTMFPSERFDLITVAQAIHWFDIDRFYAECKRVGKESSVIAVFGYSLFRVNAEIDALTDEFYYDKINSFWEVERRIVDSQYKNIPFPFDEIQARSFQIELNWSLFELQGYLNTWSSVKKYIQTRGTNPADSLVSQIKPLWKESGQSVYFPVFLRLGRIKK